MPSVAHKKPPPRPASARGGRRTDPVTTEIILGAFETICYEMATHVSLTATTPILNQSNERNATILDATGQLAALSVGIPQFMLSSTLPVRFAVEFFGADKPLPDITAGDADRWVIWLKGRYANGTAGRTIKRAKQFFKSALRSELILKNPFADLKPPSEVNESRKFFVTREAIQKAIDACPDAEWRLILALSRRLPEARDNQPGKK